MTVQAGSSQRLVLLQLRPSTRPGPDMMEARIEISPELKRASMQAC